MKHNYLNYTEDDVREHAKNSRSMRQLLIALDLVPCGGNYSSLKRKIQILDIDVSHWKGQGWSSGEMLKDWKDHVRNKTLKPHLIKDKGVQCEECKLTEWLGNPITLEMDHIDGNTCNNEYGNLRLLCPNCHSYTPTWRRRKAST